MDMQLRDLTSIGTVTGQVLKYNIRSDGLILLSNLVLKKYLMVPEGGSLPEGIEPAGEVINRDLAKGRLRPFSGLGFLILSEDVLNVSIWHDEYAATIVPNIYQLEGRLWIPHPVEEVGAYCSAEKRVYDHENSAFLRYLASPKENWDKITYVNDFLQENILK